MAVLVVAAGVLAAPAERRIASAGIAEAAVETTHVHLDAFTWEECAGAATNIELAEPAVRSHIPSGFHSTTSGNVVAGAALARLTLLQLSCERILSPRGPLAPATMTLAFVHVLPTSAADAHDEGFLWGWWSSDAGLRAQLESAGATVASGSFVTADGLGTTVATTTGEAGERATTTMQGIARGSTLPGFRGRLWWDLDDPTPSTFSFHQEGPASARPATLESAGPWTMARIQATSAGQAFTVDGMQVAWAPGAP